jgi:PPOX class probable F420-dependent enzyme
VSTASLSEFARLAALDNGLSVLATVRPDHSIQMSVVNAGVLKHPSSGEEMVGLVAVGGSRKLANLRKNPRASVVIRAAWEWLAVEGTAELIGPDDPGSGLNTYAIRTLLRDIFSAAGGVHQDWETYDTVMAEQRRTAVLIAPDRIYTNVPS